MVDIEVPAEIALEVDARLGEGPVWDDREAVLVWVDIASCQLHRFDPSSGIDTTICLPSTVGCVGLREDSGFVLALGVAFATLPRHGEATQLLADLHLDTTTVRFNDGKVDPWGRFWAGTVDLCGGNRASLYCVDAAGQVSTMIDGVGCSNGLDWNQEKTRLYYIDTATHAVDVFDVDAGDGSLLDRQRHLQFASEESPDGLCLDSEDGLWVAVWGTGEVRRYVDRRLERVVKLPVPFVTAMAFGGQNLDELYITTAAGESEQDHAGDLFRCTPGVTGRRTRRFGTVKHRMPRPYKGESHDVD